MKNHRDPRNDGRFRNFSEARLDGWEASVARSKGFEDRSQPLGKRWQCLGILYFFASSKRVQPELNLEFPDHLFRFAL